MGKLRELNNGKQNYPKETKRVTRCHKGPYGTINDHTQSNRIILEQAGPDRTKQGLKGPYRTIQGRMGPYGAIEDHKEQTEIY